MIRAGLFLFLARCAEPQYEEIGLMGQGVACCQVLMPAGRGYTLQCKPNVTLLGASNFVRIGKPCVPMPASGGL